MSTQDKIEALQQLARDGSNREFRLHYSGRGMFGAHCPAIDCERWDVDAVIEDAKAAGIRGARQDSMGLGAIVYWPSIKTDDIEEDEGSA